MNPNDNCDTKKLQRNHNKELKSSQGKILVKIENLPISLTSKFNLSNLIASGKISEDLKVLKSKNGIVSCSGRVNLELKAFSSLNLENNEVLIKILHDTNTKYYEIFSYTKNASHFSKKSSNIGSYFNRECLTILKYKNIIVLKAIYNAKTLNQILKANPENLTEILEEILRQIHDIRLKDDSFWRLKFVVSKKILRCDKKWIFINPTDAENSKKDENNFTENVSKLLELFYSYGMSENELKSEFLKVFGSYQFTCVEWRRFTSYYIVEKYFTPIEKMTQSRRHHKRYFARKT